MFKKIRFYYWLVKSFVNKHKLILIPAAIAGALTFSQLPWLLKYIPEPKKTTYIGRVGSFTLTNLPRDIQLKVSDGLTTLDSSGQVLPKLVKEWVIMDDGKTYLVKLADDIYWHDGEPVVAQDIDYTIQDVEVEKPDNKTLIFKLKEPFTPFPTILSQPIFKRKLSSFLQIINRTRIIGTGSFQLTKLKYEGSRIETLTLESNREKLVYRFYTTEQAAILGFKLAEVDVLEHLSNAEEFRNWDQLKIVEEIDKNEYVVVYFNLENANLIAKEIRQALAYMIPKSEDSGQRAISSISPDSWAFNPNVKPYNYSPENAKDLVANLKTDFELELTTTPSFSQLADEIKGSWEQLGIKVKINIVNIPDTNNYQALLIGQRIPADPDQYLLWHSTQRNTNLTRYESAKVDKLLEDGRKEQDQEKRREIYLNFQRFLLEDSPAVFLHFLPTYTVSRI